MKNFNTLYIGCESKKKINKRFNNKSKSIDQIKKVMEISKSIMINDERSKIYSFNDNDECDNDEYDNDEYDNDEYDNDEYDNNNDNNNDDENDIKIYEEKYKENDKVERNINDKEIVFNNKRVTDSILNRGKSLRNETKNLDDIYFSYEKQISILNDFYLNNVCDNNKLLRSELLKKINSYKSQDLSKNKYNSNTFISLNEVLEKLVLSKLKCYYCRVNILLLYKNVRDGFQWTLDRINNDKDHSNDNTIIACLKCNLQRRTRDKDIFLFSKQLKINKL